MTSVMPQRQTNNNKHSQNDTTSTKGRVVNRCWGHYQTLITEPGYQVKRLVLLPGKKLSLQYHNHRSEHWTVVFGLAKAIIGEDIFILHPDSSAYVPQGIVHQLENASEDETVLIEVQYGDYIGEDDIIRIKE